MRLTKNLKNLTVKKSFKLFSIEIQNDINNVRSSYKTNSRFEISWRRPSLSELIPRKNYI